MTGWNIENRVKKIFNANFCNFKEDDDIVEEDMVTLHTKWSDA